MLETVRRDVKTVQVVEKNRKKNSNKWFAIAFVIIYNIYIGNIHRKDCDLYDVSIYDIK